MIRRCIPTEVRAKIKGKTAEYKEFCNACGVPAATSKLRYECGTSDLKKTKAWKGFEVSVSPTKKKVAEVSQSATIDIAEDKGNIEVHSIGKIDREIYKCITEDIRTDEVIITDNQIQHIKDRHPDYIVETPKPNTALILKEIITEKEKFKTVLRLATSVDNKEYKNSIITFMKIDEKEWNRLLRNKRVLYKKE